MDIPTADAELRQLTADFLTAEPLPRTSEPTSAIRTEPPARLPRPPANGLAPSLESKRLQLYLLLLFGDVAILLASFAIAAAIAPVIPHADGSFVAILILPIFVTLALYSATYSLRTLTDWKLGSLRAVSSLFVAAALLSFVILFSKLTPDFSRYELAITLVLATGAMVAYRLLLSRLIRASWGPSTINRLVIDAGGPEVAMPNVYRINAREHAIVPSIDDPAALDRLAQYLRNMDEVLVSCPQQDRHAWSEVLKGSGVHGEVVSSYAREIGALGIIHHEESQISALLVSTGPLAMRSRALKRGFDVLVSGLALLFLMPLLMTFAVLIKLEDGGSIFFRQRRMGRGNRFFEIYKFRSMREEQADADGNRSASKDDDRITRIGRFMRKTSIDELPQLINVLRGDMSLVGPRPHALGSQAGSKLFWQVDRRYWQRHCLQPGITGLAQVRGYRGATDTEQDLTARLQADLEYIQGWTIWRDISVLLSTVKVLVHDRAF